MDTDLEEEILRSLRQITRSIDLHSRRLANTFGLTGPQLVCLRVVAQDGSIMPSALARRVSLSQGTITGIADRLVARQLLKRVRSSSDRRQVTLSMTHAGRALVADAPSPLQEQFVSRLARLPVGERHRIRDTLHQVVEMMGGEDLDAAPVLSTASSSPAEVVTEAPEE